MSSSVSSAAVFSPVWVLLLLELGILNGGGGGEGGDKLRLEVCLIDILRDKEGGGRGVGISAVWKNAFVLEVLISNPWFNWRLWPNAVVVFVVVFY